MSGALHPLPRRSPDLPQALEERFTSTAQSHSLALRRSRSSSPLACSTPRLIDAADCSIANVDITASDPDAQFPIAASPTLIVRGMLRGFLP